MAGPLDRRGIRKMAERWTEDEKWDGRATIELLAAFGATLARQIRRHAGDCAVAEYDQEEVAARERERERIGVIRFLNRQPPGTPLIEAAAALVRREHRR
jgi:hypothetical protein